MRMIPLDKRFKLYKTGQATLACLFTREEFIRAERLMADAYGHGEPYYPGRYRKYENVPNRRDWYYSFRASNAIDREMSDFKIYFKHEEQASYLLLVMTKEPV
jgi:hypothetical protein